MPAERKFEAYDPASGPLKEMPLLVGVTGPSFSGKSYSAGRLATGMQRVYGGQIYWIDTENDRALELHKRYGGPFDFQHVPFPQPKSPLEYDQVLSYALSRPDVGVIIIDNVTHEHVALLDMMEDYMQKKGAGDDWEKRDRLLFASMVIPKAQRKRFNEHAAFGAVRPDGKKVPILFLYRAADKTKPGKSRRDGGDGKPVHKGWQAETSSDLPFYMTARFLLPPGSDGHPNLTPDTEFEKLAIKNPQQFRGWFQPGFQLTEEIGERLARWAKGETPGNGAGRPAEPRSHPGASTQTVSMGDREPQGQPDAKAAMLAEARDLLLTKPADDRPREMVLAFGIRSWKTISELEEEPLRIGLEALRRNLDPLSAMGAEEPPRVPGED